MVNYNKLSNDQQHSMDEIIKLLKEFRRRADYIMYQSTPLDEENQREMRLVYDTVCSAMDHLPY